MVQLAQPFNSSDVEPQDNNFTPIPTAWYPALIEETEQKPTKAGTGWYINGRVTIVGDSYANRKVFFLLNLQNPSQQAMEIAYRELSAICHACGIPVVTDTAQLHNIPVMVHVKSVPAVMESDGVTEKYAAKNEINGWKALEGATNATPATNTAQATPGADNTPVQTETGAGKLPGTETVVASNAPAKPPWEQ